jgi:carbon storage regulator CsrA
LPNSEPCATGGQDNLELDEGNDMLVLNRKPDQNMGLDDGVLVENEKRRPIQDWPLSTSTSHSLNPRGADDHLEVTAMKALQSSGYSALRRLKCEATEAVVAIHGTVPSYYLKQMAQCVIQRLEGVRRVTNFVEVQATQSVETAIGPEKIETRYPQSRRMDMLVLTRKPGEKVVIDGNITVEVVQVRGNKVILSLNAPGYVRILRAELGKWQDRHAARHFDPSDCDLNEKPTEWEELSFSPASEDNNRGDRAINKRPASMCA